MDRVQIAIRDQLNRQNEKAEIELREKVCTCMYYIVIMPVYKYVIINIARIFEKSEAKQGRHWS